MGGMPHQDVNPKSFEGKTIKRVEAEAINVLKFFFTDGTSTALEVEGFGLVQCDACADVCFAIERELAEKLATIPHNRTFSRKDFRDYTGQPDSKLRWLMGQGAVIQDKRDTHRVTASGWAAIEAATETR